MTAHEDMMINSQQNIQVRAKENGIEIIENTYTLFAEQDIRFTTAAARIDCAKETRIMSKTDSKIKTTTLSWSAQKTFSLRVLGHMQGWVETARLTAHNISITSTGDAPLILSQGHAQSYFDASGNLCFFANQFFIKAPLISIYSNSEQSS